MSKLNLDLYGLEEKDGQVAAKPLGESLKADDIGKPGSSADATVLDVNEKTFDPVEGPKVILTLAAPKISKEAKRLALNKTNLLSMLNDFGTDTGEWLNAEITLKVERTAFQGKQVPCVRIYKAK